MELAPSYDFAHFMLGMAYRGDGQPLAALQAFRRGLRLDPGGQAPALGEVLRINPDFRAERARGPGGRVLTSNEVRALSKSLRALRRETGAKSGD